MERTAEDIKIYFVNIPEHKFMHSGQIMAFINEPISRIFYFHHDPERFWKYIRPVLRINAE